MEHLQVPIADLTATNVGRTARYLWPKGRKVKPERPSQFTLSGRASERDRTSFVAPRRSIRRSILLAGGATVHEIGSPRKDPSEFVMLVLGS